LLNYVFKFSKIMLVKLAIC